ncbi:hypothetical protein ACVWWK_002269 [Bradyrhizobium sp. LB9.1b]
MAVDRKVTRSSQANKASVAETFPNETLTQIAKHREIARRYRPGRGEKAFIPRLRIAELERFFAMHYGARRLPDDDGGRADLRLMADHLAQIDPRLIREWTLQWMPTFPAAELGALITDVGIGRRWKADSLARELRLDDATRTRLKIKTIGAVDCGKAKRMTRRRRKRIAADRARRAKAGARPHTQSTAATQPWIDEAISRATYYRRLAARKTGRATVETDSRPIDHRSSIEKNECHSTTDPGREHSGATSTFIAEPLSSLSSRVARSCNQARTDPIAGLDDASFQAAHLEHHRILSKFPLGAAEKARLAELDEVIETERERRAIRSSTMASPGMAG